MMDGQSEDPVPSFSERIYRKLLLAYPKGFRIAYGARMEQAFRDLYREKRRRGDALGLMGLWVRVMFDLVKTALEGRSRAMRWKLLVPLAVVLGLLIALVDSSPGWDDTGVSAAAVFACCGLLGALHPARPWLWALCVGLWIPALGIAFTHNYGSALALLVAFAGAYVGAFTIRFLSPA